jgi:hypothetical protein
MQQHAHWLLDGNVAIALYRSGRGDVPTVLPREIIQRSNGASISLERLLRKRLTEREYEQVTGRPLGEDGLDLDILTRTERGHRQ